MPTNFTALYLESLIQILVWWRFIFSLVEKLFLSFCLRTVELDTKAVPYDLQILCLPASLSMSELLFTTPFNCEATIWYNRNACCQSVSRWKLQSFEFILDRQRFPLINPSIGVNLDLRLALYCVLNATNSKHSS